MLFSPRIPKKMNLYFFFAKIYEFLLTSSNFPNGNEKNLCFNIKFSKVLLVKPNISYFNLLLVPHFDNSI